ncbi:hypothetical protein [Amycolatopsis iheyensis]|nr:hypothetical protein [Amycolatopsis iheyensis]
MPDPRRRTQVGAERRFEDTAVHHPRTGRAPLAETVTFVDG